MIILALQKHTKQKRETETMKKSAETNLTANLRVIYEMGEEDEEYAISCTVIDRNKKINDYAKVEHITPAESCAKEIFEQIVKHRVSACTLGDVIIDLVC